MKYAKVEKGKVIKEQECPKCTKLVSNFYLMSDAEKISHGWYPLEDNRPNLTFGKEYSNITYDVQVDKVVKTADIMDGDVVVYKNKALEILNSKAKKAINNKYDFETLLYISLGIYGANKVDEAKAFIQTVMQKRKDYKTQIENATTIAELDFEFIW